MNPAETKPNETLDVAVEEREAWKRRLTVTVDASRVARERSKERRKLSKKLRLKGFRAGKVPTDIVEQRYGDLVDQRTVQRLLEAAYRGHYAYPAVNVTSMITVNAVLKGLADKRSDGIIQVSTGGAASCHSNSDRSQPP